MTSLFNSTVNYDFIKSSSGIGKGLMKIEPKEQGFNSMQWIKDHKTELESKLLKYGGILLRNFNINSISEFNKLVQVFSAELLDYMYRSTPRTKLGGKIYTATEYPKERSIPLHNENSYSKSWPAKIFFYGAIVASQGGETPIADSRIVYDKIALEIREKFEKHGILYVRNYTTGIDLNWQEVFQTDDVDEVNKYCQEHDIEYEWRDSEPKLTTRQICQTSLNHPKTNEKVWFNQAHLFHISSISPNERQSLLNAVGKENLPRNTFFGNGEPIDEDTLNYIREIYHQEKIKFLWQKGDVMILDNILMAHSREPFEGERKVAVAMI